MRMSYRVVLLVVTTFCGYLCSVNASGKLSVLIITNNYDKIK